MWRFGWRSVTRGWDVGRRLLAMCEERKPGDGHEAVEHEWSDGGSEPAVVPRLQDAVEVSVGDGGGAEGDGAGAAVAGECPLPAGRPCHAGEDLDGDEQP